MTWFEDFKKMSEAELSEWISTKASLGSDASNLAIAELNRRSIISLKNSIDKFSESSDRYSKQLLALTWVLVFLTIILAYPIAFDLLNKFI